MNLFFDDTITYKTIFDCQCDNEIIKVYSI